MTEKPLVSTDLACFYNDRRKYDEQRNHTKNKVGVPPPPPPSTKPQNLWVSGFSEDASVVGEDQKNMAGSIVQQRTIILTERDFNKLQERLKDCFYA